MKWMLVKNDRLIGLETKDLFLCMELEKQLAVQAYPCYLSICLNQNWINPQATYAPHVHNPLILQFHWRVALRLFQCWMVTSAPFSQHWFSLASSTSEILALLMSIVLQFASVGQNFILSVYLSFSPTDRILNSPIFPYHAVLLL